MTTPSDYDCGYGSDASDVITDEVVGTCLWCSHYLVYANPRVPMQGLTDKIHFYEKPFIGNDYSLLDFPLDYGKFCPFAPPHPLGQFTVHQLVPNNQQT